jgi:hypothetical protein
MGRLIGLLLLAGTLPACAGVHGVVSNDTGGIIPWSPEHQFAMHEIAGKHCAHYEKRARITSVHRVYGDYIGFKCFFPRGYDPVKDAARARWYSSETISTLD